MQNASLASSCFTRIPRQAASLRNTNGRPTSRIPVSAFLGGRVRDLWSREQGAGSREQGAGEQGAVAVRRVVRMFFLTSCAALCCASVCACASVRAAMSGDMRDHQAKDQTQNASIA
jgi:hypothetical protein